MGKAASKFLAIVLMSLMFLGWGMPQSMSPAQARAQVDGYSIVLTQSNATTYYGNSASFRATLTYPQPGPFPNINQFQLVIDGQPVSASVTTGSGNTLTLFGYSSNTLDAGSHTAISTYFIASSQTTVQSNLLTHTVLKSNTAALYCSLSNIAPVYTYSQSLTVKMTLSGVTLSADPPGTTFTIIFVGPTTTTYPHLKVDSQEQVTIAVPAKAATYEMRCIFDGTQNFNSTGFDQPLIVSAENATGAIQLYTNPSTIVVGQIVTYYIVVNAAPGLPTPGGFVDITVGDFFSGYIHLSANGDILVRKGPLPRLSTNTVIIQYSGDPNYNYESVSFPLTNPPISGQGGTPTSSGTPSANGTPSSTPTRSTTAVIGAKGTPTAVTSTPSTIPALPGSTTHSASASAGGWMMPLIALIILVGGGGLGGMLYLRSRGNRLVS